MRTQLLKTTVFLLILGTGLAAVAAAPRLAVVAVTPAVEGRTVADQLTAALSRDPATLALVERQQIDAVLRELGLAAAQGRGGQLALGERLNAQGLLLLEVAGQALTARLVDSSSGLILFTEGWPVDAVQGQGLPEAATARLRERILAGLRQAAALAGGAGAKGVTVVAVAPLRNRLWNDTDNRRAETLSRLLALQLSRQPGLLLVERDELRRVAEEKTAAAAEAGRLVAAAAVVTGNTLFAPAKTGDGRIITVETAFQRAAATQPGPAVTGDAEDLMGIAAKLAGEIAARLRPGGTAAAADSASAIPFDAAGEARYFLWLAKTQGNDESRRPFLETAYALNPQDPEIRQTLASVLLTQPYENWARSQQPPPKRAVDEGLPDGIRALRLLMAPPATTTSMEGFSDLLIKLKPEPVTPEQRGQLRQGRVLLRRYQELEWDVRDGVPHHNLPWIGQFFGIIPAMIETPEEAMAYLEPMAAHWLRSPERMADEGVMDIFQNICGLRDGYAACPRWSAAAVEPLFDAMLVRLQPLAKTGDPLFHAQLDFIRTFREKDYQFQPQEGYPPQGPEAVTAARNLLTAYQVRAAGNPKWGQAMQVPEGMRIWRALSCLPWPEQETWFDKLFLPALQQGYTRNFSYPCGVYFGMPPAPAPSPEYRRMVVRAYAVLSRQSGQDLDNVLQNLRNKAKAFSVTLTVTDGLPGNGTAQVREIDLSAAGLPKAGRCFIAGFVQEPETIWLQVKGDWDGVLRYDISQARVTGAVKRPWGSDQQPKIACGGQQMAVTADAVWWSEYNQIWRMPKTAFTLPATTADAAASPLPGLAPPLEYSFAVVDGWVYWVASGGSIWRRRYVASGAEPGATAECVADSARVGGTGPLDGGGQWWPSALTADPLRHRVLWMVNQNGPDGPRNGVWSHLVATGRLEQVMAARFSDLHANVSTVAGDRWVYSGQGFVSIVVDLLRNQVAYNLKPAQPFSWQRPGAPQPIQAPMLSLAANSSECFDGWTISGFTVTPATSDALLLFAPRGDNVRVRVFTPTACLAEVKNDARLLDQLVGGAWWTPRGILVAAVPERTGPMKLWLYETTVQPATAP